MSGSATEASSRPTEQHVAASLSERELEAVRLERAMLRLGGAASADVVAIRNVLMRTRSTSDSDALLAPLVTSNIDDQSVVAVLLTFGYSPVFVAARLRHRFSWSWTRVDRALNAAGIDLDTRRRSAHQ